MKTAAIICEYNPFHNGHKYHIEQTRLQHGATHIVCGNAGEEIVLDEEIRLGAKRCIDEMLRLGD